MDAETASKRCTGGWEEYAVLFVGSFRLIIIEAVPIESARYCSAQGLSHLIFYKPWWFQCLELRALCGEQNAAGALYLLFSRAGA